VPEQPAPTSVQVTPLCCASFCNVAVNGCAVETVIEGEGGATLTDTGGVRVMVVE